MPICIKHSQVYRQAGYCVYCGEPQSDEPSDVHPTDCCGEPRDIEGTRYFCIEPAGEHEVHYYAYSGLVRDMNLRGLVATPVEEDSC